MTIKNTLSISEARKKIFKIAEETQKPGNYYTFTENGRPKVVLMSAEEFESWQETLEVMRDFPNLKEDIKEA
jgi:prevent-host-death family protein